jgi:protein-tyrosine phosphatase
MSWTPESILAGAPNARDLGGMPGADGRRVKYRRVIRSGPINEITPKDAEFLKDIGLHTVADFRTDWEKLGKEDEILDGVEYVDCPMIEVRADGITRRPPTDLDSMAKLYTASAADINRHRGGGEALMRGMYTALASSEYSIRHYRQFFRLLLDNDSGAVLYHCTMGKDRVGAGTAFLLTALGVPREYITEDYMYTKTRLGGRTAALLDRCRAYTDDPDILETIRAMDTVDESYIGAVYAVMDSCGSPEGYLRDKLELAPEDVSRLRELYLD